MSSRHWQPRTGSRCTTPSRGFRRLAGTDLRGVSTRTCCLGSVPFRSGGRGSSCAVRRLSSSKLPRRSYSLATTLRRSAPSDSVPQDDALNDIARWLDGSGCGGVLRGLFGAELTDAPQACESCGDIRDRSSDWHLGLRAVGSSPYLCSRVDHPPLAVRAYTPAAPDRR